MKNGGAGLTALMTGMAAVVGAVGVVGEARGSDLSSNLGRVSSGAETAMGGQWLAANFASGATAHTLSAVVLKLANPFPGSAEVRIYRDGGLEPGVLVGTLTSPQAYTAGASEVRFRTAGLALAAGTTYWVVLQAPSGRFDWSWAGDTAGTGEGFLGAWGVSEDAGAFWWAHSVYPLQMRVVVDACAGDFNGDGFVDFFDYDAFVACFETGVCGEGSADVNGDGFVDFFDYDDFVAMFEAGC